MKKIVFLTGTRADFGKLKSLIEITVRSKFFDVYIFVTGMHMNKKYGNTYDEIQKCGYDNVYYYRNHIDNEPMDIVLSKTITGFSQYIHKIEPDLIVIHGDRVETLAGAIVGSLNDVLTAHIEGGEVSGTVDELIRHAVSKMCHIHFVSNDKAKQRLVQMGEEKSSVFVIGSPDIDIMLSDRLPKLEFVKEHYEINFQNYSIMIFHPVVSEFNQIKFQARNLVKAILKTNRNYIIVYPNNDRGCHFIFSEYKKLEKYERIRIYPSIRFEYFIVLLKNSDFIIGNSSSGIREASYYGIPTVNIGTRQLKRSSSKEIINCGYDMKEIELSINKALKTSIRRKRGGFGEGNSDKLFIDLLKSERLWNINKQKQFRDLL